MTATINHYLALISTNATAKSLSLTMKATSSKEVRVWLGAGRLHLRVFRWLNLTGAPIHGLIDCVAVNVFR